MVLKLSNAAPCGSIPDSKRMCLKSMRLATIRLATTAAALIWLPGGVVGQVVPSPYRFLETKQEVVVFVGTADPSSGQSRLGLASANVFGAIYSVDFGSTLTFELGTMVFKGDREVQDVRREEGDRVLGSSDLTVATGEARFRLNLTGHRSWHRMRPFILMGAGWAFTTSDDLFLEDAAEVPDSDRYNFGTKFTAVAGGGIAIHASSRFTIRIDGSLHLWKISTPLGFRNPALDLGSIPDSEWVGTPAITVGTGIRF